MIQIIRQFHLPATYVREVSENLNSTATNTQYQLRLLSLFPVNPEQGPRDNVERAFMEENFDEGATVENRFEVNGNEFFTLYVPDVANAESCVSCHNGLEESPKRDYVLGDVMGTLAITVPMNERLDIVVTDTATEVGAFAGILLLVGGLFYFIAQRTILRPINRLQTAADNVLQGDFSVRTNVDSTDELGQLSTVFDSMTQQFTTKY